jgi:hypothetical protein
LKGDRNASDQTASLRKLSKLPPVTSDELGLVSTDTFVARESSSPVAFLAFALKKTVSSLSHPPLSTLFSIGTLVGSLNGASRPFMYKDYLSSGTYGRSILVRITALLIKKR